MASLFDFIIDHGILIYKPCAYAVPPSTLSSHLANRHPDVFSYNALNALDLTGRTPNRPIKAARALTDSLLSQYAVLDPRYTKIPMPSPDAAPIPGLKLHYGLQCNTCNQIYTETGKQKSRPGKGTRAQMLSHYNTHRTIPRRRGKQSRNNNDEGPEFHKVYCQRFFVTGPQSNLFAVTLPPSALEGNSSGRDKASKEGGL